MGASELQGRIGRTRRESPGVPLGTYVEVEQDVSRSGWHIWLTQRDPRDGPSEGSDMWADTQEDLRAWLGADELDVEWFTDRLPDETLDRIVGTDAATWRFQYVSPEGAAAVLYGADVSLRQVELVDGAAVVAGIVEAGWERPRRLLRGSRSVVARFLFVLVVEPATEVQTDDPEKIDQVLIDEVHYDAETETLTIESAIPGSIRISTPARTYRLAITRLPALVRRWWRWLPLDATPDRDRLTATAHGLVGCTHYAGPPQVNPAPSRTSLRGFGLPEPHQTLEVHLADLRTTAKRAVLSRLLIDLGGDDAEAELHEAKGYRARWRWLTATDAAAATFERAVDTDAWWASDLALLVRTHRGLAVVCSAQDGQCIVVITGGYKRTDLNDYAELSATRALSDVLDGA